MARTTISVPDALWKRIRLVAAERGVSATEVVRKALEREAQTSRPKPRSIGIAASGYTDTAQRSGEERPEPRSWR